MLDFPTFNTKDSDDLCKEISRKSNGVCAFMIGTSQGQYQKR